MAKKWFYASDDPAVLADNERWRKAMIKSFGEWFQAHMAQDDIVVQREGVERTREWQHGPLPKDRACDGMTKPIYVPPGKLPDPCRRCGHDEWFSNGIVLRGKDTKKVVHREKGSAPPRFHDTIKWVDELAEFVRPVKI